MMALSYPSKVDCIIGRLPLKIVQSVKLSRFSLFKKNDGSAGTRQAVSDKTRNLVTVTYMLEDRKMGFFDFWNGLVK